MPETDSPLNISFDDGLGTLTHHWGGNIDWSVPGEVTLTGWGGFMEYPSDSASGHGYGTYTVNARLDGGQPGPAILLWPGDDSWPGQEIDIAEVLPDGSGRHYGTTHWDYYGSDAYESVIFDDVYGGTFHDYTVKWEPDRITYFVDGVEQGSITENVPRDHDNGGMNNAIGIMNINDSTSVTVREVDYRPLGDNGWSPSPAATPEPAERSGPVDWEVIAAQVVANYEATGSWFY